MFHVAPAIQPKLNPSPLVTLDGGKLTAKFGEVLDWAVPWEPQRLVDDLPPVLE
jgi:hypothetical protein